jgi:polar amino acid transport system substrate-binding protein
MRHYYNIIFFIAMIFAANSTFCQSNTNAANIDVKQIITNGKLVIALPKDDHIGLFEKEKSGKLKGYDIELAQNIAKTLGVTLEFNRNAKTYDEVVTIVANGGADIAICNLSKTFSRAEKVLYSNTDTILYQTILANSLWLAKYDKNPFWNKNPITQILQKEQFSLGVISGSSYIEFAKKNFPHATITQYPSFEMLFSALKKGEIQALLDDDFDIKARTHLDPSLAVKFKPLILSNNKDFIAMAVSPNNVMLQNWLNIYLELKDIHMNADKLIEHNNMKNILLPMQQNKIFEVVE